MIRSNKRQQQEMSKNIDSNNDTNNAEMMVNDNNNNSKNNGILLLLHLLAGLCIRLIIGYAMPHLMDTTNVPYTDIDYHVFIDAADYILLNRIDNTIYYSPYNRTTYRYTPFLASIVSKVPYNHRIMTRYLFCIADTFCGCIIILLLQHQRSQSQQQQRKKRIVEKQRHDDDVRKPQQQQQGTVSLSSSSSFNHTDTLWWLYNPFAINICTRGSAESFVVLLPVLITIWIVIVYVIPKREVDIIRCTTTSNSRSSTNISRHDKTTQHYNSNHNNSKDRQQLLRRLQRYYIPTIGAGLCHGIAIHAKLYPVIYTLSYMAFIANNEKNNSNATASTSATLSTSNAYDKNQKRQYQSKDIDNNYKTSTNNLVVLVRYLQFWIQKVLYSWNAMFFGCISIVTFLLLTYLSVKWYGRIALEEGLLYHFSRTDHRHNYSIHWYWIYLLRSRQEELHQQPNEVYVAVIASMIGKLLLLPQLLLLVVSSLRISSYNLCLGLFVQTFLFVTHNKVITAQYFTWYLCLLPLCANQFNFWNSTSTTTSTSDTVNNNCSSRQILYAILFVLVSIVIWLGSAYCLEMLGLSVHIYVWVASILYFISNVNLLRVLLLNSRNNNNKRINIRSETLLTTKKQS